MLCRSEDKFYRKYDRAASRAASTLQKSMGFVDRPRLVRWRKGIFQVHLWTGAVLALYVVAISVSGSILVFERDLMNDAPRSAAGSPTSARIGYPALVQIARAAHPRENLDAIDMRTGNRSIVTVALHTEDGRHRNMYLDAYTGRILEDTIAEDKHPILTFLEPLHNELLGGPRGEAFNGIGGALLFLLGLTGIVVWWPGRKYWTRAIKVNWKARWKRLTFDLHSAFGFWSLVFVAMWGLSGFYFAFPEKMHAIFGLFPSSANQKQSKWTPKQRLLGVGDYLVTAEGIFPDSRLAYLYMDVYRTGGQVSVFLSRDPRRPLTLLEDIVRLDPASGDVLQIESSRKWSLAEKVAMASYSVHFGDFGDTWSKIAWVVLGLAPAALAITGCLMWWNRVLMRKWRALHRASTGRTGHVASAAAH